MPFSADVLVIIESCHAAGLALSARNEKKREGRLEVIAASTYPDGTWLRGVPESFNSPFCQALIELASHRKAFTTGTLYHEILSKVYELLAAMKLVFKNTYPPKEFHTGKPLVPASPIHLNLTRDPELSLIQLTPLIQTTRRPSSRRLGWNFNRIIEDFDEIDLDWFEDDDFTC